MERLVTIYVSKGGETIEIPDLVGLTKFAAIERIQKMGLQVGSIYEKDSEKDPGTILAQDPAVGTKINRGQFIDLTISRGQKVKAETKIEKTETPVAENISVPNVNNVNLEIATSILKNSGLSVGTITYEESPQAEGTIVSQYPDADSEISAGTSIDLIVAIPEQIPEELPGEYKPLPENLDSAIENIPSREDDEEKFQ